MVLTISSTVSQRIAIGLVWTLTTPRPDLLVTGDGRHLAIRTAGGLAILRDRAGDYTRNMLGENAGEIGALPALSDQADARCSRDLCVARTGDLTVLATRSFDFVDPRLLAASCAAADVVVSDRRLPWRCRPRWLKLDRPALARTGGVAIAGSAVRTVFRPADAHPWRVPPTVLEKGVTPRR